MARFKNLLGNKYEHLTVLKKIESDSRCTQWLCRCDCGNEVIIRGSSLISGNTKSCGCKRIENCKVMAKNNQKTNTYDLSGEYGIGYTSKGEEFYFDLEDYDKIKDYCWHIYNKQGYLSSYDITKKKKIMMHRLIMNCPNGMIVDHIHGSNTVNDNRKSNLRIVTIGQNNMNRKIMKNNTSGITGVGWHKNKQKWSSSIRYNGKLIYLGDFENKEDAIKARKEAEQKYFGEYSYDNSINIK